MDAEVGLSILEVLPAYALENLTQYTGPMTHDKVVTSFKHMQNAILHHSNAAAAAIDAEHELLCLTSNSAITTSLPRQHALPEFSVEAILGKDGAKLREIIER